MKNLTQGVVIFCGFIASVIMNGISKLSGNSVADLFLCLSIILMAFVFVFIVNAAESAEQRYRAWNLRPITKNESDPLLTEENGHRAA